MLKVGRNGSDKSVMVNCGLGEQNERGELRTDFCSENHLTMPKEAIIIYIPGHPQIIVQGTRSTVYSPKEVFNLADHRMKVKEKGLDKDDYRQEYRDLSRKIHKQTYFTMCRG